MLSVTPGERDGELGRDAQQRGGGSRAACPFPGGTGLVPQGVFDPSAKQRVPEHWGESKAGPELGSSSRLGWGTLAPVHNLVGKANCFPNL